MEIKDVTWLRADGHELTQHDWHDRGRGLLGMLVHGHEAGTDGENGIVAPETLLLVFNADDRAWRWRLPLVPEKGTWVWRIDTARADLDHERIGGKTIKVAARALALLEYKQVS